MTDDASSYLFCYTSQLKVTLTANVNYIMNTIGIELYNHYDELELL